MVLVWGYQWGVEVAELVHPEEEVVVGVEGCSVLLGEMPSLTVRYWEVGVIYSVLSSD